MLDLETLAVTSRCSQDELEKELERAMAANQGRRDSNDGALDVEDPGV